MAFVVTSLGLAQSVPSPSPSPTPGLLIGISANPSAANAITGTGELEKIVLKSLGVTDDHGVRVGGVWIGNSSWLISGGEQPGVVSWNNAFIADLLVDLERLLGWWKGASFGMEFLQFNGQPSNQQAGSVQGYNSMPGHPPLDRTELYQLWIYQRLFHNKVSVRIGKCLPNVEFGNVLMPDALPEKELIIPSVSGLMYTPVFVNPTMLGVLPGYYNSACGVTTTINPVDWWYAKYGFYDGSLAGGTQTGLTGPNFTGHYLNVWETGFMWRLGSGCLPGKIGTGYWYQTGQLSGLSGLTQNGTSGYYLYGSQRLWYRHPKEDTSGISSFFQFGVNNSSTLPANQYFGMGFTGFGLVPSRPKDSIGVGTSWAWLDRHDFKRPSELMFQTYYQANLWKSLYLEPGLTYIPTPGAQPNLASAWALTIQMVALF
jgi:porin